MHILIANILETRTAFSCSFCNIDFVNASSSICYKRVVAIVAPYPDGAACWIEGCAWRRRLHT